MYHILSVTVTKCNTCIITEFKSWLNHSLIRLMMITFEFSCGKKKDGLKRQLILAGIKCFFFLKRCKQIVHLYTWDHEPSKTCLLAFPIPTVRVIAIHLTDINH